MEPDERPPTLARLEKPDWARLVAGLLNAGVPSSGDGRWECPRCGLVARHRDPAPRCQKCGFWDTVS